MDVLKNKRDLIFQKEKNEVKVLVTQSHLTLCNPTTLLCPWNSPGKNTGVSCHFLLQGIFLTQGLNSGLLHLLHCRKILYIHQGMRV